MATVLTTVPEPEPEPAPRGKKRWADLTPAQKAGVVVLGTVQIALLAVAATDLVRRPPEQVRGPKWAWAPALAVNFVGPVAYLTCGRRR
jgi:hypothetical protein